MKLSTIFAAATAALMLATSCGILGGSSTTATPTSNGQASGAALRSLYTQYKADGKMDMTNISNIINLATLSQAITELKDAGTVDKSGYIKEFATGLILGSNNLVNQTNSTPVVSNLTNLANVNLSSVTGAAATLLASGVTTAATQTQAAQAQTAAAQTTATNTANAVTSAIAQVGAASTEVSQAVSSLQSIFNLFSK